MVWLIGSAEVVPQRMPERNSVYSVSEVWVRENGWEAMVPSEMPACCAMCQLFRSHAIICSSESFSAPRAASVLMASAQSSETAKSRSTSGYWETASSRSREKNPLSAKFRVGEGAAFRQGFFVGNKRQTGCQTAIREITQEVGEMFFFHRIGQLDAVMAVAKVVRSAISCSCFG